MTQEQMIKEIYTALVGDELHGEGIVKKVQKLEKTTNAHNTYFKFVAFLIALVAFLSGIKNLL